MERIFLLICSLAFLSVPGRSQTAILHPVKDNTIFSENGTAGNGAGPEYFVGRTGSHAGQSKRRGLLQFDLVTIPAGSVITAVTLTVACIKAPSPGSRAANTVGLHKCFAAWGEGSSVAGGGAGAPATSGDATWTCRFANGTGSCIQAWTLPGGDFSTLVSSNVTVNDTGKYTFASTTALIADVQGWVDTPASNFGWVLRGDEVNAYTARAFRSREGGASSATLIVNYTPQSCTNATWTGAVSLAWEHSGNWSCGEVPDANTNVIVNSGTVILNSNVTIRSLVMSSGVNFTINSGFELTVIQ